MPGGLELTRPVIVLAGGRSSRMGEPKGLVDVRGRAWILRQLETFAACGGSRAIVVLGHRASEYFAALEWLAAARDAGESGSSLAGLRVAVVVNGEPELGTFSSVQCGARAALASGDDAGAFVLPVDVPCAARAVWQALDVACTGDVLASVPVYTARSGPGTAAPLRGGHPVACARELLASLATLDPALEGSRLDVQLRAASVAPRVVRVATDDARVVANLNTPDDWAGIRGP